MSTGTQRETEAADEATLAALVERGDYLLAEPLIRQLHAKSGARAWSVNLLAVCLRRQRRFDESIWLYRRLLQSVPEEPAAWRNLANVLCDALRFDESIAAHRRAIELQPLDGDGWTAFGRALARAGRTSEALAAFEQALAHGCATPGAVRWDQSLGLLSLGRYQEGWQHYGARWDLPNIAPPPALQGVPWDGQAAFQKRLVLREEQGFGDVIQCLRYVQQAAGLVREVAIALRPELARLLSPPPAPNVSVVPTSTVPGPQDLHASLIDLPRLFTASPTEIPAASGYLKARPEAIAAMRAVLDRAVPAPGLRVGIIWSGSAGFSDNANRRAPIERFLAHFAVPGVSLVSLQKGPQAAELDGDLRRDVFDLSPHLKDFADTAAACEVLDLVVMTDSAVAHLCGALGRPVWIMMGAVRHWPWGIDGERTPWYNSARIYRQASPGEWGAAFGRAGADLMRLAADRPVR